MEQNDAEEQEEQGEDGSIPFQRYYQKQKQQQLIRNQNHPNPNSQ